MPSIPTRLHGLDALRGVAALAVVLCHWEHFAVLLPAGQHLAYEQYPGYAFLWPLYRYGWMAPDLFFVLSGFVFLWLYGEKVAQCSVSGWDFSGRRFARLYPLHLLTLLLVAVGQWLMISHVGTSFIYRDNNAKHFALHLIFAQDWTRNIESFNGPTWSVSIEVLLYVLFFVFARLALLRGVATAAVLVAAGLLLYWQHDWYDMGRGVMGFFAGCISYRIYLGMLRNRHVTLAAAVVLLALFGWWAFTRLPIPLPLFATVLCPLCVALLALHESVSPRLYRKAGWLGEISYSSYLWHFPLQLAFAIIVVFGLLPPALAFTWPFLVGFYLVLIFISLLSYRLIERPAQHFILRRFFSVARGPVAAGAGQ